MSTSPLYRFDVQIWERLIVYIDKCVLLRLLGIGDRHIMQKCAGAIRRLDYVDIVEFSGSLLLDHFSPCSPPPMETTNGYFDLRCGDSWTDAGQELGHQGLQSLLLELALSANLECLGLDCLSMSTLASPMDTTLLNLLPRSNLTILQLEHWVVRQRLHLPSTLTCLQIAVLRWDSTFDAQFVIGDAKLRSLLLGRMSSRTLDSDAVLEATFDCLVNAHVNTLEYLNWGLSYTFAFHLHRHLALRHLAVTSDCLVALLHLGVPPRVTHLSLHPSVSSTYVDPKIFALFEHLEVLNLSELATTYPYILDISKSPGIRVLKLVDQASAVECAPVQDLCIVASSALERIYNTGIGKVTLSCDEFIMDHDADLSLMALLDWQTIQSLTLDYLQGPTNLDYGPLKQAINVSQLDIWHDNLYHFRLRSEVSFMACFANLCMLSWKLDADLYTSLDDLGFVLPPTISVLKMSLTNRPTAFDGNMKWLRHVPKLLNLQGVPLVPKIVSMCNSATVPLSLRFVCPIDLIDWREMPILEPPSSVVSLRFRFTGHVPTPEGEYDKKFDEIFAAQRVYVLNSAVHVVSNKTEK